jgi:hypothetical protein
MQTSGQREGVDRGDDRFETVTPTRMLCHAAVTDGVAG